ncbi:TniQ family protein [Hydrogenophaga sp.]
MKFAASPTPIPEESRACWIQRVCGAHDYSMNRFCKAVGLDPSRIDWDRSVTPSRWTWLAENAGRCLECFDRNDTDWELISQVARQRVNAFFVDKKPASKWCPICLAEDPIPYLRWHWRIAELRTCPFHDIQLSESCTWCGACLNLSLANLVPWGPKWGASSLAECASCGMPRLAGEVGQSSATERSKSSAGRPWEPLQEVRSVLTFRALQERGTELDIFLEEEAEFGLNGVFLHPTICRALLNRDPLGSGGFEDFYRRQTEVIRAFTAPREYSLLKLKSMELGKADRAGLDKYMQRCRETPFDFNLGSLAVSRVKAPGKSQRKKYFWTNEEVTRWSTRLSPLSRIRLAKALVIVRREKNRQRSRGINGIGEQEEQQLMDAHFGSDRLPS